jgi:hypothetical protein
LVVIDYRGTAPAELCRALRQRVLQPPTFHVILDLSRRRLAITM